LEALKVGLEEFSKMGVAPLPYQPHGLDPATLQSKTPEPAKLTEPAWMSFVMPYGKSKVPLGKMPREELDFHIASFEVKESVNGVAVPPESVKLQKALRAALDEAAAHFNKPPTKG
jgi:hypothetical protein